MKWIGNPSGLAVHILVYLAISAVFLRVYLLSPGTVGHNWDWTIPPGPAYIASGIGTSFSTWSNLDLGYARFIGQSPPYTALLLFGSLGLSGEVLSKIILWVSPVASATFANVYVRTRASNRGGTLNPHVALLGGLFYGFSGVQFYWLLGGAPSGLVGNALMPAVLASWEACRTAGQRTSSNRLPFLVLAALMASLTLVSLPHFAAAGGALLVIILLSPEDRLGQVRTLAKIFILCLPGLAFTLVPTVFYIVATGPEGAVGLSPYGASSNLAFSPGGPLSFIFAGFFQRDMYYRSVPPGLSLLFLAGSFGLFGWALWSAVRTPPPDHHQRRTVVVSAFVYVLFAGLSAGTNTFGPLMYVLYAIPLLVVLRSTIYYESVASAAFVDVLAHHGRATGARSKIAAVLLVACLLAYFLPWYTGDLGLSQRSSDLDGTLDQYTPPPDYSTALSILAADPSSFNILPLPMNAAPYFLPSAYQRSRNPDNGVGYVGGEASLLTSSHGILTYNPALPLSPSVASLLKDLVRDVYSQDIPADEFARTMSFFNVKYVLLLKDYNDPQSVPAWNATAVGGYLSTLTNYTLLVDGPTVALYRVLDADFGPQFYLARDAVSTSVPRLMTLVDDNASTFWSVNGQGITAKADPADHVSGNSSLEIVLTNASGAALVHVYPEGINLSSFDFASWALESSATGLGITFKFQTGSQGFFTLKMKASSQAWNTYSTDLASWTATGRPTWSNITFIRVEFPLGANATVHLDYLQLGERLVDVLLDTPISAAKGDVIVSTSDLASEVSRNCPRSMSSVDRVSNTEYTFQVDGACPFLLVFQDAFHPLWQIDAVDSSGRHVATEHVIANGYANGWVVDATGSVSLHVVFAQQQVNNVSFVIGAVSALVYWIACIAIWFQARRRKRPGPSSEQIVPHAGTAPDEKSELRSVIGTIMRAMPWKGLKRFSAASLPGIAQFTFGAGVLLTGISGVLWAFERDAASLMFLAGYFFSLIGLLAWAWIMPAHRGGRDSEERPEV